MTQAELNRKVDEFVAKYENQTLGYPEGSYIGQCLSLVKVYIKEVFGINPPPSGNGAAWGYWLNFPNPLGEVFTKVPMGGKIFKGCVPIWNTNAGNGFGHIDIFLEGDGLSFTGLDQNWGGTKAHRQAHTYTNVVGWLAPKIAEPVIIPPVNDDTKRAIGILEVIKAENNFGNLEGTANAGRGAIKDVANLQAQITTLQDNHDALTNAFDIQKNELLRLGAENEVLRKQVESGLGTLVFKFGEYALYKLA